jgi:hypothetical protein
VPATDKIHNSTQQKEGAQAYASDKALSLTQHTDMYYPNKVEDHLIKTLINSINGMVE